jgi:hypothetical protein
MASKRHMLLALGLAGVFAVSAFVPLVQAGGTVRIVWPYGVNETFIPVIAGYKVFPDPQQCGLGTPGGNVVYQNDFGGGFGDMSLQAAGLSFGNGNNNNLFHVTAFQGVGTDGGHSAGNRVYWGIDSTGNFHSGFQRNMGSLVKTFDVPAGTTPYYVSVNTKWATEWLEGYDHMWIEAWAPAPDNHLYILCTFNPEGRGDPSSSETESLGSCSPYSIVAVLCPSDAKRINNLGVPAYTLDPDAPHWESRFVQIPPIWNGQTITLRFTFDSSDGVSNTYLGWMLDDVAISDGVTPVPTALPVVTGLTG